MENIYYKKAKKFYFIICALVLLFFISLFFYHYFGFKLTGHLKPCMFNYLLHIYCPGCGGTRAMDYFLHGQFIKSFLSNPAVLYLVGLFLSYFLPATYSFIIKRNGKVYYKFHPFSLYFFIVEIILFFIIRNAALIIFHYDFLGDCIKYWV